MHEMLPITAPPKLWSHEHDITALFTWDERPDGWFISGPFERLTHYTVGGAMTADGPMILRHDIDGPRFAQHARRAAEYGEDFYAQVPNQYRSSSV